MKFREVTSKLVFPSALVAIGSYIFIVFISWRYIGNEPPDALLALVLPVAIVCVLSSAGAAYTLGINMKCPGIRVAAAVLGVVGGVMIALLAPIPWIPWIFVMRTLPSLMAIGGGILALRRPAEGGGINASGHHHNHHSRGIGIELTNRPSSRVSSRSLGYSLGQKTPRAIYVAMILGIIGGVFAGMIAHGLSTGIIWIQGIEELPFPFWTWVLLFPIMGSLGGILVLKNPKVAARLMLISAISGPVGLYAVGRVAEVGFDEVGFVYAFVFAGIACFLLIIASAIAFIKK